MASDTSPDQKRREEILKRDAVHQHFGAPERIADDLTMELAKIASREISEDPPSNWSAGPALATQPPYVQKEHWVAEKFIKVEPVGVAEPSKKLGTEIPISMTYLASYSGPELSPAAWDKMSEVANKTRENSRSKWGEIHEFELITPAHEQELEKSHELALQALESGIDQDLVVEAEIIQEQARLETTHEFSAATLAAGLDPTQVQATEQAPEANRHHEAFAGPGEQQHSDDLANASFSPDSSQFLEEGRRELAASAAAVDEHLASLSGEQAQKQEEQQEQQSIEHDQEIER